jgi:hypothetical protein
MTDGELLHTWGLNLTSSAAAHAVRARRCALLHRQVWDFSGEASIFAMPRLKPLNFFLALFPVHSAFLDD